MMKMSLFPPMPVLKVGFHVLDAEGCRWSSSHCMCVRWGNRFGLESYPLNAFVFIQVCLRNALPMPLPDATPLDVCLPNMGL